MKRKILFFSIIMAMLISTCHIYAEQEKVTPKIKTDFASDTIEINGETLPDSELTFLLVPKDTERGNIWANIPGKFNRGWKENNSITKYFETAVLSGNNDILQYVGTCKSDENGIFYKKMGVSKSGEYSIVIGSDNNTEILWEIPVSFISSTDYKDFVQKLNSDIEASSETDFISDLLPTGILKMGFDLPINSEVNVSDVLKLYYNEVKNSSAKKLDPDNFTYNLLLYKQCAVAVYLNGGKGENVNYIEDALNDGTKADFASYVSNSASQNYFIKKLQKRDISEIHNKTVSGKANFDDLIKEAMLLTAIKYSDGSGSVKEVMTKYNDILKISPLSSKTSVYNQLTGKDFTLDSLISEYNRLSSEDSSPPYGGNSPQGNTPSTIPSISVNSGTKEIIPLIFDDLDVVPWAYQAISTLYDAKIISGFSAEEFAPNENVTREQFAKMLVGVFGDTQVSNESDFSDVNSGEWYAGYVNTAYKMGYINGMGNNLFGVGRNISRQDMVVMIYNALKSRGFAMEAKTINFDDASEISDYALDAVSTMVNLGIINGKGNGKFEPKGNATRAEAAVVLFGLYNLIK